MPTTYLTTTANDGYATVGPVWDGTSTFMSLPADGSLLGGLLLTGFPVASATRIRPPSPIYTAQETYTSIQLRVTKSSGFAGTLTVRLTPTVVPVPFGPGNLPDAAVGTTVAQQAIGTAQGAVLVPLSLSVLTQRYRRRDWQGSWALTLQWTSDTGLLSLATREAADALATPDLGPALLVEAVPEMSGLARSAKAQSRADRCPRCARPSLRETWVRDGYGKLLVCPDCYDPPDPLWRRRVPRPVRPGINDAG